MVPMDLVAVIRHKVHAEGGSDPRDRAGAGAFSQHDSSVRAGHEGADRSVAPNPLDACTGWRRGGGGVLVAVAAIVHGGQAAADGHAALGAAAGIGAHGQRAHGATAGGRVSKRGAGGDRPSRLRARRGSPGRLLRGLGGARGRAPEVVAVPDAPHALGPRLRDALRSAGYDVVSRGSRRGVHPTSQGSSRQSRTTT
jgi:hypothetical protein